MDCKRYAKDLQKICKRLTRFAKELQDLQELQKICEKCKNFEKSVKTSWTDTKSLRDENDKYV